MPGSWDVFCRRLLMLTVAGLTTGCGGGDGGPTGNTFSIQVSASPSALSVPQGGSGSVTLTLTRGGGFTGDVSASVSGLPTGVTTSVTPATLSGATILATVNVNVAASVAPGTYTATISATASGVGSATATYQLTVTALPNYALSMNPAALTVPAGTTGNASVNIARTNFTGAIALTLDNPPAGITGVFTPASAPADLSALAVTVAPTVGPGNHTLTIKGSATGPGDKTTTLTLAVTAAANYTLAAAPSPVTIVRGQSSDVTVTITRTNFTGAVTLSLVNPPAGVTGVFAPASPTGGTSTLTVSAGATAAPGTHTITVMGTAAGVPTVVEGGSSLVAPGDRTTTFQLVVELPPAISLGAAPAALTLPQGGVGQSTVTITRTNYTQAVTLTPTGMPAGMDVVMNTTAPTGATSTATVTVGLATQIGSHPITITGTGAGVANAQTVLTVNVTAPAVFNVEYQFRAAPDNPDFFAFQDGPSGTWTRVHPILDNGIYKYRMNMLSTGRSAVHYLRDFTTPAARAALSAAHGWIDPAPWRDDRMTDPLRGTGISAARTAPRALGSGGGGYGWTGVRTYMFYGNTAQQQSNGVIEADELPFALAFVALLSGQEIYWGAGAAWGRMVFPDMSPETKDLDPIKYQGVVAGFYNGSTTPSRIFVERTTAANVQLDFFGARSSAPVSTSIIASNSNGRDWSVDLGVIFNGEKSGRYYRSPTTNLSSITGYAPAQSLIPAGSAWYLEARIDQPNYFLRAIGVEGTVAGSHFPSFPPIPSGVTATNNGGFLNAGVNTFQQGTRCLEINAWDMNLSGLYVRYAGPGNPTSFQQPDLRSIGGPDTRLNGTTDVEISQTSFSGTSTNECRIRYNTGSLVWEGVARLQLAF